MDASRKYILTTMPAHAVLMPNWIGDLLLALSVVQRKQTCREPSDCSLIVPRRLVGLTKLLSNDLPVIPYRRENRAEYRASVRLVREYGFSKLYILPHSFSSALFGFSCGVRTRRGVLAELRGLLLTERLPMSVASRERHLTYEYAEVLETHAADPASWQAEAIDGSEHVGAIVFCPGAAYGPAKQWPFFDRLSALFPENKIIILGDSRDAGIGSQIAAAAPARIVNLAGKTTLEQAAAIIAGASLVVSNDSGLLHLAGFLGTPSVGIYGSTSSVWTRPLGPLVRIAQSGDCERAPCYDRVCPLDNYNCLRDITPEQIAALGKEVLR